MLDVNEASEAASFLGLGDNGEGECGFAGTFGAEDFDDSAAREATDAEGAVYEDVAGRNDFYFRSGVVAESADGLLAVIFCDLLDCKVEVFVSLEDCRVFFSRAGWVVSFCHGWREALQE